jgi:hypothetical protein
MFSQLDHEIIEHNYFRIRQEILGGSSLAYWFNPIGWYPEVEDVNDPDYWELRAKNAITELDRNQEYNRRHYFTPKDLTTANETPVPVPQDTP